MIDETGKRYGRLTVKEKAKSRVTNGGKSRLAMWLCVCDCGLSVTVSGHDLRRGNTTSCGCARRENLLQANTTHGDSPRGHMTRLYRIWANINTRCCNPHFAEFKHYGGKGIKNEFESYAQFKEWAYANGYREQPPGTPPGEKLSIDRVDTGKGYSPENCRWISLSENSSRRNRDYWSKRHGDPNGSRKDTCNDYGVKQSPHETPRVTEL